MTLERDSILNGRYRILEILGQGGMGAVYHAKDDNLDVHVAVKENLFTSDEYSRQFRREANILATMRHPNLPRVIDHFEIQNQGQYMVMDFIEGEDLRQRMDRIGSLMDEEVIIIGAAICDALEYLHTRDPIILHRDIKPGNIKVNPNGEVYLVDFGLAKIVDGSQVTTTGARAMTPGYSSPEQYGTARTDERSDIYSLGATLYAALTNTIPEDGLARAMEQADLTPIRKRNPKVSRRVASAVEKALAIHPEDRFQKAGDFKNALLQSSNATRQIQNSEELTIIPPPADVVADVMAGNRVHVKGAKEPEITGSSSTRRKRLKRRRIRRTIFATLIVLISALIGWVAMGLPGKEAVSGIVPEGWIAYASNFSATLMPGEPTTPVVEEPTLTATIEEVIPEPTATQTPTPTVTPTITPSPTPIRVPGVPTPTPAPADYDMPFPGEQLAYVSLRENSTGVTSAQIWLHSFADGSERQLTKMQGGACQPDWSPDGRLLAFISPCAGNQRVYTDALIYVLDMQTTEVTQLAVEVGSFDPAWSPDGSSMLFTRAENILASSIYRINTSDSTIEEMTHGDRLAYNPAWSPEGDRFVFSTNSAGHYFLYIVENDPTALPEVFARITGRQYVKPTWSVDNTIVFSTGPEDSFMSMWQMPASMLGASDFSYLETPVNPDTNRVPELDPDFNSSGHWIAYESWPDGGNRDIYIIRDDGQLIMRVTEELRDDFDPAWRPYPRP
ncbi:MAG: serine/threonine-protein kinase [Anaerolineales bacterium]|nr:serine/threonine-protein kinase [Anaerolineales bacterium]